MLLTTQGASQKSMQRLRDTNQQNNADWEQINREGGARATKVHWRPSTPSEDWDRARVERALKVPFDYDEPLKLVTFDRHQDWE